MTTEVKKENEVEITNDSIAAKVTKGETLTEKEREFIKGNPNLEDGAEEVTEENDDDLGEETPEDKKEEAPAATKDAAKAAPEPTKKPGEQKKETSAPTTEDRRKLIEAELDKPLDQQELSGFSESEIGTFVDLKKERSKNKRLQEENDALKFEKVKKKLEPEEEPEEEDPAAKIGDEDIVTGKQLKELLARKPKATKKGDDQAPLITPDIVKAHEVTADAALKAKGINDYAEVSQWVQFALYDDPEAANVVRETAKNGGNVALECYRLVKGSKKWPQIKAAIETQRTAGKKEEPAKKEEAPPAENVERADRIKKNTEKVSTTGAGGGAGDESGEYTAKDIQAMSTEEFGKLPRETRTKILKKFGSEPNMR